MATKHLHVLAIASGEETGWCRLTVPRYSMFGDEQSEILERDYGTFSDSQAATAIAIARLAATIQSLDYKTGPAIMIERWRRDEAYEDESYSPTGLRAMLDLLRHEKRLGDATLHYQPRDAAADVTDDVLRAAHMLTGRNDINDAHRHAITTLRRAKTKRSFAHELWPYPPSGTA